MFKNLKSLLFGNKRSGRPLQRKIRLGVEALETRANPCARIPQLYHYTGLEGVNYHDQTVAVYQMPAGMATADYRIYGGFWSQPAHVQQKGQTMVVSYDLERDWEGTRVYRFAIVRKRDNTQVACAQVTFDVLNAALSPQGIAPAISAVSGQDTGSTLLATFTDTRLANVTSGTYHATINWGDGKSSEGEVRINGNTVQVFGAHLYTVVGQSDHKFKSTVTLQEGSFAVGSKFCSSTHIVKDAAGVNQSVGGMAAATVNVTVSPAH